MKLKWNRLSAKRTSKDMFKWTQRRLMLQYSAVLIAFLALFVATVYGLLYYLLINDQKSELEDFINDEIHALHETAEHGGMEALQRNFSAFMQDASGRLYPVYRSADGSYYFGENVPSLFRKVVEKYAAGMADSDSIVFSRITVQPADQDTQNVRGERMPQGESRLLLGGKPLIIAGDSYGTLYALKEATGEYKLFDRLLLVLAGIGLLFCAAALFLSARMSARAMIPIRKSYQRQLEFVADASHELRTPLSVFQSSLDALEMEEVFDREPFAKKLLGHLKVEVKRMTELTGSLLTLARSDSEEHHLALAKIDIAEEARRMAETFRPLADERNLSLTAKTGPAVWMQADSARIRQLMVILLDNAMKYTPPGGHVTIRVDLEGDKRKLAVLSVDDTGIGIPEEDRERIFERFYRVDKSRARAEDLQGGHGLGLSIAKWIAEAHHGNIRVSPNPGGGSVFTVHLPV